MPERQRVHGCKVVCLCFSKCSHYNHVTDIGCVRCGYTTMNGKSCCQTFTAVSTAAHFVMCNLYLSGQLVRLMLKIVMENGSNSVRIFAFFRMFSVPGTGV